MLKNLKLISYPDPRLKKSSAPVEAFDAHLRELAERMLQLMREHRGVGLAAPQVGRNIRLFVMNPTGEPDDDRVYVNPQLTDTSGEESAEEGCLSIPGINADIVRSRTATLRAHDLEGKPIELTETGYIARIWQHEIDHLDGVLIIDRMGATAKMMARRTLKDLEEQWASEHPAPPAPKSKKSKARSRR
jgi:peptide deformylase